MGQRLDARRPQRVGEGARQVLQDDTTGDAGEALLELCAVVADVAADVDKDGSAGVPVPRVPLERGLVQPAAPDLLLEAHVPDQGHPVLGVLGEPRVRVDIGPVGRLEDCGLPIRDVLVVALAQEGRHFLEQGAAVPKAVKLSAKPVPVKFPRS